MIDVSVLASWMFCAILVATDRHSHIDRWIRFIDDALISDNTSEYISRNDHDALRDEEKADPTLKKDGFWHEIIKRFQREE